MDTESTFREQLYRRPIGYLEARHAAQNLRRYFDLIKLVYSFLNIDEREEIVKKYPQFKDYNTPNGSRLLRTELNRLSIRVYWALLRVNAPLAFTVEHTGTRYDVEKRKTINTKRKAQVNLILDQFEPDYHKKIDVLDAYEMLVNVMERAIPLYRSIQKNYWKNWVNPIWILATILRIPISLLEYMGIDTRNQQTNKFVYWLIQLIVLIALGLLCVRLRLSTNVLSM